MQRWFSHQTWEEKQIWSPWLASLANRRLLARNRKRRVVRPVRMQACEQQQQSLFAY
jgi:hypothetical protein